MKAFLLTFLLLGLLLSTHAQTPQKTALDSIVERLQSGVYERTLNLGYIPSLPKFSRNDVPVPHNEFTMMILRFYDFTYDSTAKSYIGKVFMGERYVESHYNKKYNSVAAYADDKDGFFMACKLFYHERSMEYRLNVYPEYILNICDKARDPFMGTHFNTHICNNTATHWQSIRYLAAIDDKSYNDLSEENDSTQILRFLRLAARSKMNIDTSFIHDETQFSNLNKKQKNTIREINLRKHIKCFTVGNFGDVPANWAKSLKLRFTKYSLSEDILENAEYEFQHLALSESQNTYFNLRSTKSIFITRNPLYRSLVVSFEPDETYVPDIPKLDVFTYYDNGQTTIVPHRSLKENNAENEAQKTEKKVDTQVYVKQQSKQDRKSAQPREVSPAVNADTKQDLISASLLSSSLLNSLRGYINIVSADNSPRSWIHWHGMQKVNDTITIQKDTYLRDDAPEKLNGSGWLKGGIKGVARQHETYKVYQVRTFEKHVWFEVGKIGSPQSRRK